MVIITLSLVSMTEVILNHMAVKVIRDMKRTRRCYEPIRLVIKGETRLGMSASSLAIAERLGARLEGSATAFSLSSALEMLKRPDSIRLSEVVGGSYD